MLTIISRNQRAALYFTDYYGGVRGRFRWDCITPGVMWRIPDNGGLDSGATGQEVYDAILYELRNLTCRDAFIEHFDNPEAKEWMGIFNHRCHDPDTEYYEERFNRAIFKLAGSSK